MKNNSGKYNSNFFIFLLLFTASTVHGQIITTIVGNGTYGYNGDGGQATAAELKGPSGVALDNSGNIYIADLENNRIRMVNTLGIISTIAGDSTEGYGGDGGLATAAELDMPNAVAIDPSGNILIVDENNNRIRKVNGSGIITTVAGNGAQGFSGDGGQATDAELYLPSGIAIDASGNIYIADYGNNCIRMVNKAGIISTIAGNGIQGYSGDGKNATAAELFLPDEVTVDRLGNLYITDWSNYRVRKVNKAGIISTIAGNGIQGYSGDGKNATVAELGGPTGVSVDTSGNVYIADYTFNNRLRMVNTSGIINTIAGNGTSGYSGDGGQATAAELVPIDVTVNTSGDIYVCDYDNNRIRLISKAFPLTTNELKSNNGIVSAFPNPSKGIFTISSENSSDNFQILVYNLFGQSIYQKILNTYVTSINLSDQAAGVYLYRILSDKGEYITSGKLIIE